MANQPIKFECSPADSLADSFVSTPGTLYPSLFPSTTRDLGDALTPPLDEDDEDEDEELFSQSRSVSVTTPSAPEKRPAKKRKSWGQQLPEPKTNLPPRKRAKTEDEKEQRRVERVLRNRRAAQSSRERKRLEVEALEAEKLDIERRNHDLELRLADAQNKNMLLEQKIAQITCGMTVFDQPSPVAQNSEPYRQPSPITLSQQLFSSHDIQQTPLFDRSILPQSRVKLASSQTVNPASVSPEIRPVVESFNARSSDMTQHPAAMLCDLQCQSEANGPWMITAPTNNPSSTNLLFLNLITATISTFLAPLAALTDSLRTGSCLLLTNPILSIIIWLATTPASLTTSTSTTTLLTPTPTSRTVRHPRLSLRMNLLRRLLSCSPHLARPLMDATMGAMRSASEHQLPARDCFGGGASACGGDPGTSWGYPSMECLMTLLWATDVIHREWLSSQSSLAKKGAIKDIRQPSLEREDEELLKLSYLGIMGSTGSISLPDGDRAGGGNVDMKWMA
ncbi:MAG: hypothetical protein M1818_002556 [Claussenomyces sp. TS43310]|nr:MAG: hypothetical protein M1818_002556 [Claussenomyces sp. TS43310]